MAPGRQLGLLWGGVALVLTALSPLAPTLAASLPSCLFRSFTGIPCPTCGTTRAALALARLEPLEALLQNPLATLGWTLLVGGGLLVGGLALAGRPVPKVRWRPGRSGRLLVVAAILVNWLYLVRLAP